MTRSILGAGYGLLATASVPLQRTLDCGEV